MLRSTRFIAERLTILPRHFCLQIASGRYPSSFQNVVHEEIFQGVMEQIESLFAQAEELETGCEFDKVIEIAQQILQIDPSNIRALLLGASCYVSKEGDEKDDDLAIEWYKKAIQLEPDCGYDKFFALAQIIEGEQSIQYYEQGIRILDGEITRTNDKEAKEAFKADRIEGLRSVIEVLISDMDGAIYLNKAKDLVHKLLKDSKSETSGYDIFLLAQIYDKCGKQFKPEIKILCEAITRRLLAEEVDNQSDDKTGSFVPRFASFCMDYGFLRLAKYVIDRLGLIGGKSAEYLSLKSLCYRLLCDKMLKKCNFYADTCIELIEELEEEDEAEGLDDVKQTVEEIKKKTPLKLEALFSVDSNGTKHIPNGDIQNDDDDDDEIDSEAESDDEDEFPLTSKPISTKRYQKLWEIETKKVLELCRRDFINTDVQDMDIES